jgi:hypothetical protein
VLELFTIFISQPTALSAHKDVFIMSFDPTQVAADPVIQVAVATTANVAGQTLDCDTSVAGFAVTLPDAAADGAEFNIRWAAGANALTVVPQTPANYKVQDDLGVFVTSISVPVLQAVRTFKFERLTPTTGQFIRV